MDVRGVRFTVFGMAKSGTALCRLLAKRGAIVRAADAKPLSALPGVGAELDALREDGGSIQISNKANGFDDFQRDGGDGSSRGEKFDGVVLNPGIRVDEAAQRLAIEPGQDHFFRRGTAQSDSKRKA